MLFIGIQAKTCFAQNTKFGYLSFPTPLHRLHYCCARDKLYCPVSAVAVALCYLADGEYNRLDVCCMPAAKQQVLPPCTVHDSLL